MSTPSTPASRRSTASQPPGRWAVRATASQPPSRWAVRARFRGCSRSSIRTATTSGSFRQPPSDDGSVLLIGCAEPKPHWFCSADDLQRQRTATRPCLAQRHLEIVAVSQGPSVGCPQQVARAYSAGGSRSGGVDVAHEQARYGWQSDRAALLQRGRRIVDHQAELCSQTVLWVRFLERVQKLAQELA